MSAGAASQKSEQPGSSETDPVSFASWDSEYTGAPFCSRQLLGSARGTAGTGTQQHSNY